MGSCHLEREPNLTLGKDQADPGILNIFLMGKKKSKQN